MKVFVVDQSICNGCYCCQIACKDEHVGNDWMPYARPQPDAGQFWVKVQERVRGSVPKVRVSYRPQMCMHCEDAPCMKACQPEAIYRRDDGLVVIDPAKCTGCKLCPDACPYEAIYFNDGMNLAQKCTGCAHLLDDGWDMPRCVDACASGALKFGEAEQFKEQLAQVAQDQLGGRRGRVVYLNAPKTFVAGTIYEPTEKEVIIGATCTLTDSERNLSYTVQTDGFGDFWFEGLPEGGTYSLRIDKSGKSKLIENIDATKDVNLGDIPMGLA
jgi:Fe-S-cluster-containing dehydrogenase component